MNVRKILAAMAAGICAWLLMFPASAAAAEAREKVPILLDTDLGPNLDGAFALSLLLSSPEVELRGVTTAGSDPYTRALIVCRLLQGLDRGEVPVASGGKPSATPDFRDRFRFEYRKCFKVPVRDPAVEFLYRQFKAQPGKLTLVLTGPLTNASRLLAEHPDCKPWIKRIVFRGGPLPLKPGGPAPPPANIRANVPAARKVLASGIPLLVLSNETSLKLEEPVRKHIFARNTSLTQLLCALYQHWKQPPVDLEEALTATLSFAEKFGEIKDQRIEVDDQGCLRQGTGKANARLARPARAAEFAKWYEERVAPAGAAQVPAVNPTNVCDPVPRGGMPNRVHAIEDYETDIEKHWWNAGTLETVNVPPGSRRACRGVLCHDYDDATPDPKAMYTAVIFNPVPGPPMGANPRLGFRYWLKGSATLRVQIYSLTKGYHRYLTLLNLPQGNWQSLAVDMTKVRRADGSGGPLSEDERIDDIQFYTDAGAELLIDDMVLYDAAVPGEKRPFPKRPIFTGWFDTGRQGKEWPGSFGIVKKDKPLTWKAAKSVNNSQTGTPWVRLHLRGQRPLGETTRLFFRYKLSGAGSLRVSLVNRTIRDTHFVELKDLKNGQWAEATVDFTKDSRRGDGADGKPRKGDLVDEIQFLLPKRAELLLDDVLLYEPGIDGSHSSAKEK